MRTAWKRTAVGLVLAGLAGGAALGLARPSDPPAVIPLSDGEPTKVPDLPVIPASGSTPVVATVPVEPAPKNDPAVALDWSGPAVVKVGKPAEYTLTVRNTCAQPLQKVVVQVRAPKGVAVKATSPAATPTDDVHLWELGTLDAQGGAKAAKAVKLTLVRPTTGELNCQAWVTLTGTAAMTAAVKEPKLAVVVKSPEKVVVGDKIPVEYVVTNTGDLPAENVVLRLANSATPPMAARDLKPGETHKLTDEFVTTSGGTFTYEAVASGADGLSASAKTAVQVLVPKLDVSVTGPADRLIGKKAAYTVTVRNCGDVPVTGVIVREHVPAGFRVVSATADGVLAPTGDRVSWSVGDLAAGAVKELAFDGVCTQPGSFTHRAEASGDRNTKAAADCGTKVEGIPALRMEMVDAVDPVEKGGETVYEIKVTNTGTKADADVKVVCEMPKEFEYVSCSGPTQGLERVGVDFTDKKIDTNNPTTRTVVFEPISELAPKTEAVFKVRVKAVGTGDVRFKAVLTSKHLTAPVTKEESTRVYGE